MNRQFILLIMFLLTFGSMSAQNDNLCPQDSCGVASSEESDLKLSRNLFVEYGGPSYGIGIGYDQRFNPNSIFGFRAGLGFTNGDFNEMPKVEDQFTREKRRVEFKGVTLPLEVNSLLGYRASMFELGIGATPCILKRVESISNRLVEDGVKFNIFGSMNIGYRLQHSKGFFMRVGGSFLLGKAKCSPMDGLLFMPYLSLGYTIR